MKIKNITVVALSVLGVFGAVAKTDRPEQLKVLMIGNSFSICNLRQMPQIADSMGLKPTALSGGSSSASASAIRSTPSSLRLTSSGPTVTSDYAD